MNEVLEPPPNATGAATRRRRRWLWVTIAIVVGCAAFVLYWFQPQKLVIDDRVNEAIPTPTTAPETQPSPGPTTTAPDTSAPAQPLELARGEFVSLDHGTSGTARVLQLGDGSRIVRLEGLDTSNGPDLFVYLSTNASSGDEAAFDDDFINLGRLKGNQGDQNYDLPTGVDVTRFASVVVWCDRFDSAFGAADLSAV